MLLRLHKQVDGIVHRFADQRRAKPQCDAVHGTKTQADSRDAGKCSADDGQQAQCQCGQGAIDEQEQRSDKRHADEGKTADLAFDGVARGDGKHPWAGHHQFRGGCIAGGCVIRQLDGAHGGFLGIGVGSRRACLHQHQGA